MCVDAEGEYTKNPLISSSRKKGKKKKKERREEIEEAKCETAEPEEYGSGRERERRGQTFATSGGWVKMTRVKEKEGRKTVVALIGHHRH